MIGWKVVQEYSDGTLGSAVLCGDWAVTYEIGARTTGRKGTPVLAFRTRRQARRFKKFAALYYPCLFKARLENPRTQDFIAPVTLTEEFAAFWGGDHSSAIGAPTGTLACDSITLLEPAR